jgi:hypothetical protein
MRTENGLAPNAMFRAIYCTRIALSAMVCTIQFLAYKYILHKSIGFSPRDGEDFRSKAYRWQELTSDNDRKRYFEDNGVRWTEFARLTYFDIVRCSVIDPMHNLLQGVVKNQWFSRWIKTGSLRPATERRRRELSSIHEFMDSVCQTRTPIIYSNLFS